MSFLACGSCTRRRASDLFYAPQPENPQREPNANMCEEWVSLPPMEPRPEHYELVIVIGKGSLEAGTVHLARHLPSGTLVAVKRVWLEECALDISTLHHETSMHNILRHPNLLPAITSFVHRQHLWTVFPLMAFGSCRDLLHAHFSEGLSEAAIMHILYTVLSALEYLHGRGKLHRSVRASHVLVSASGHVALSGLRHVHPLMSEGRRARRAHDFPNHYKSSLLWASPEMLQQDLGGYDSSSDIYSVGILACELANGVVPFADMASTHMLLEKVEGTTPRLFDSHTLGLQDGGGGGGGGSGSEETLPYQRSFSAPFHQLVELCLQAEPGKRPSATALMQHAFFRQVRFRRAESSAGAAAGLAALLQPVAPLTSLDLSALPPQPPDANDTEMLAADLATTSLDEWSFE